MYTFIFFIQEAFYLTDRVMTLSFHKYGNHFFPGTGKCIIYTVVYITLMDCNTYMQHRTVNNNYLE